MFGAGVVTVLQPTTRTRLQVAYSAPGDLAKLRKDLPELKRRLLPTLPDALRPILDRKLDADTEWQILRVAVDRLKRWHVPGLLFIGDAAHTMSPSGGQGLNVAIRDAVVTANHFLDAPRIDADVFSRIEAERLPEVVAAQAGQIRAGKMVLKPRVALHLICTLAGVMMGLFMRRRIAAEDPVAVRHPVRIDVTGAA
jgi:2-polyprenyl-6-methoxyphenol hydroxylase-like FAD-dependent oxidoreductase